jgi:signal transduction histidine kinase
MTSCLAVTRRAADLFRRRGTIVVLGAVSIAAVTALAGLGIAASRAGDTRVMQGALAGAADTARVIVDRDRRLLDRMTEIAPPDGAAGDFLDQVPALAPGIRAAMLLDPAGIPVARAAGGLDDGLLARLGHTVARAIAFHPGAGLVVIPGLDDAEGAPKLAALARPWSSADGLSGGIAVIAIDRTAFAALDALPMLPGGSRIDVLTRGGVPLFTAADAAEAAGSSETEIVDFPLMLRYRPITGYVGRMLEGAAPFALLALVCLAAAAGLAAMVIRRDRAARREISRRASVERQLREQLLETAAAADRTDEINRAKSRFFAQVTHELRTPLNAILGFSETIRHEMFGPVANPRYREYAELINDAGSHLLSLINDLLDNARIEAGKMEIAPIRVSAAAVARSALDLVELLAEERRIALVANGLGLCPDLNIDPRAMKQVLVNLLSNAIKYTPPGGKIELRFAGKSDGSVAIEVADSGTGMSAEDVLYAFEPFGRAGADQTRRQPGTGLGLSLARALVRLHGGDLTLASRLDAGTTATVTLPASAVFAATASAAAASGAAKSDAGGKAARAA